MYEIINEYSYPRHVTGFSKIWYSAKERFPLGIKVNEEAQRAALQKVSLFGISLSGKGKGLRWRNPFLGDYFTNAFLYKETLTLFQELKVQDEIGLKNFPRYVLSIISQSRGGIEEVARDLSLPVESLAFPKSFSYSMRTSKH